MYKCLLLFGFVFLPVSLFSQAELVYDARNDINQTKNYLLQLENIAEAIEQTTILDKTLRYYEQARKVLQKVNSVLNDISYVESIVRRQMYIIRSYSYYMDQLATMKNVSASDIRYLTTTLESLLNDSERLLEMADKFLQDDYFEMNDNDRISSLERTETKMSYIQTNMGIAFNQVKSREQAAALIEQLKSF